MGELEVVKVLIQAKASINLSNRSGWSPLSIASFDSHLDVVKELLSASDIDIDKADNQGRTPLLVACFRGHLEISKALIIAGAQINSTDNNGWSPL